MTGRRVMRRRGFTLVELISTVVILAALGSVASGVILTAADGYVDGATRAQLHTELSTALDRCVREVRNIQLDGEAGGVGPDIDEVTATSMRWDDDWSISLTGERVMLTVDGGPAAVLLADVTSFGIQMWDEDDAALGATLSGSACDAIRRVRIDATVSREGVSERLRTKVFIRSTMAGAGSGS